MPHTGSNGAVHAQTSSSSAAYSPSHSAIDVHGSRCAALAQCGAHHESESMLGTPPRGSRRM